MTPVLELSYFNTVCNQFYTRNNRNEQVFYNFKIFYNLKMS